ncbi:Cocaine esterase [Pandoraea captiosa]|uniref:Cocaine esterase n=1 Tax=Pandoraea captiosa TaxID=2508302 RepID=A0A5E4ZJH5_9BURK|nr:CocE/NonD family hydrolase [Pandoraea captiosa]VVE61274.1 Cocaine esterase [Pandoraea captiosa]
MLSHTQSDKPDVNGVVVERAVPVTMSDGCRLIADIYRPASGGVPLDGPFAVLVERTPYGRTLQRFMQFGQLAAQRGYVFVIQDVRGRGDSDGHFEMMTNRHDEGRDGAQTLAWVHEQAWCDGRIGTVGGSYSAANQQAAALHHPAGLRAQVLRDAGTNYYQRSFRKHGTFNVGNTLAWIVDQCSAGKEAQRDPRVRAELEAMKADLASWTHRLPLRRGKSPIAHAPEYEALYFKMLETSDDESFWQSTGLRIEGHWDRYPQDVAVMLVSGWFATHAAANFEKFNALRSRLKRPVQMIVGPWIHSPTMLEATHAGIAEFGPVAAQEGPINETWLCWMDRWVRDEDNGTDEKTLLRYFVMGTGDGHLTDEGRRYHGGEWRTSREWPLPETRFTPYYLDADGRLHTDKDTGAGGVSRYTFDPQDPCPGIGSTSVQLDGYASFILSGPQEQRCLPGLAACRGSDRPLKERADMLVFDTPVLDEAVEVTGPVELKLWVSTTARDTDFAVQLVDVYPPGALQQDEYPLLITEGVIRMRYRNGLTTQSLLTPGDVYEVAIELTPTSNVFKKGHRIRLQISSSSFPQYDVNPNTGEPMGLDTHTIKATQTIYHDASRPSHLMLPIQPRRL